MYHKKTSGLKLFHESIQNACAQLRSYSSNRKIANCDDSDNSLFQMKLKAYLWHLPNLSDIYTSRNQYYLLKDREKVIYSYWNAAKLQGSLSSACILIFCSSFLLLSGSANRSSLPFLSFVNGTNAIIHFINFITFGPKYCCCFWDTFASTVLWKGLK